MSLAIESAKVCSRLLQFSGNFDIIVELASRKVFQRVKNGKGQFIRPITRCNMSQHDQKAAEYDKNPNRVKSAQIIANFIEQALPLNKDFSAMEFGCGTGLVTMFLRDKLKSITAIDNSSGMLEKLKEKIHKEKVTNVTPVQVDLTGEITLPDKYDIIFSSMTFHHIEDYQFLLEKIFEMLKPNGMVAIADLEAEDGSFHSVDTEIAHKGFEKGAFAESLKKAGFVDVKCTTAFVIPGSVRGSERDYPIFLATGKKTGGF